MENRTDELLEQRRPIEAALREWMIKWIANERARGRTGNPFSVLRPIEEVVRNTIPGFEVQTEADRICELLELAEKR